MQFRIGEATPLPNWPGHALRVDNFQPVMTRMGPPEDMISEVTLLSGDKPLVKGKVQINKPLLHNGVVITPVSFGQFPVGLQVMLPGISSAALAQGERIALLGGKQLDVLRFLPDVSRNATGGIVYRSNQLGNPAFELRLSANNNTLWQGYYLPREQLPRVLRQHGIWIRPLSPLVENYSVLTVNYDPGAMLATAGSALMTIGVMLALFSFYRKRKLKDRPEI